MIGAIAGDVIGSIYEFREWKSKDFPLLGDLCSFTDDTVLTGAIALAVLEGLPYRNVVRDLGKKYPHCGYGGMFKEWLFFGDREPYYSFGNGSAMRVSPVGFAYNTEAEVLEEARKTAEFTHDHPEGIKGAQATALPIFRARTGASKEDIRTEIADRFEYDLSRTVDEIRPDYFFDETCQGTVPEAIISFLDSETYEDAIRNAISLGGDADTLACITGGIAHAFYGGVPEEIAQWTKQRLDPVLLEITESFCETYEVAV